MSSFFLFSASITLVLLSTLSLSTADLVDTDGDPIRSGKNYYIIPINTTTPTSGLTYYAQKEVQCPLYITKDKTENSGGTPVWIWTQKDEPGPISLDEPVSLIFESEYYTPCLELLAWGMTMDPSGRKVYITAGSGNTTAALYEHPFTITKKENSPTSTYELKYKTGTSLGLYEDDGLLGFAPNPTMVSFVKAGYFLELPTTSKIQ
ncbi:hypothetical protein RND81_01G140300 [Saponaria officinalis]|uniref:Uncharacterized protein n=1 Tax=Saponaria officinalis TaxID=3572 RepID=A0AAW1NH19_SAPOF